ncbi:ABC transporter substrate-binding protein [Microbacterium karelineae]|uniref:ABC transporter substrate-binding protein n=1 Tax=Microbacterium karelineae TaxID=2654283 RepID=UPI0012EAC734|nr:sugar ABC transporter substrate-binding protein [Microbacterium karelineae]
MKNAFGTRAIGATALLGASALALTACGGGSGAGGDGVVDYWLWDANQLPAYQQCAEEFNASQEDVTVEVTQTGWDDYWSKITNGMAAGTAPDVFTDHLSKYPDFVATDQLLSLDDLEADTSIYNEGLADLWVGQDGSRYGLPKDWDTVALFYNSAMAEEAGLTEDDMANLDWNPDDGGSYEDAIARLTVDENGVRGDEDGFDKDSVAVYGLGLNSSGEGMGQTEWSYLTATLGWTHTDENPWGEHYNYDQPEFHETFEWWASLVEKGYMPPLETTVGASAADNFGAAKTAINSHGSWMIGQYAGYDGIDLGIAPTPIGPSGERASMFNGLADSIWAGTENPEGSLAWVEYLASAACQDVVAEHAVVFPAISSSSELAAEAFAEKGVDVSAFTTHVEEGTTFLFPIAENAAKVVGIMKPASDAVLTGGAPASSFTDANDQVNALFE